MLQLVNVSFSYTDSIFTNISFELGQGEIIGIVGTSGTGKTTLLKVIAGLLEPTSGQLFFEGQKIKGPSHQLVPGHDEIKLVNQDFGLDIYQTVSENIIGKALYLPLKERNELVNELLDLIELSHLSHQKAIHLSGGEQQRLALARALAGEPKLILLDEPFVHLDGRLRLKIVHYILKMKEIRKTSFLLVSHDGAEMLSLATKIIHFSEGQIKRIASPYEFYFEPETKEQGELFGVLNRVEIDGEEVLFRPTEFKIEKKDRGIKIKYFDCQFVGSHYLNYFKTQNNETICLFSQEPLRNEKEITIKKRNSSPVLG